MNEIIPFAVTTQSERNVLSNNLNYTNQDYGSLKARMLEIMQQKFAKNFTDFSESSLAMMLVELWAFMADQLSFKIDQIANELFIDTVTESANIMRLADFVGFKPTPPTPAKAMFVINLNHMATEDFLIDTPLLITFESANGSGERYMELFQADQKNNSIFNKPILIPTGSTSINNIVGIEGRTNHKMASGTGHSWQQIPLSVASILWGSINVKIDGVQWQEVDFFTGWEPRPEFRVEYLNQYKAVLIFGDNTSGLVPPKGSSISITYRTGGGSAGNIVTGSVEQTVPIHIAGLGRMISCSINNYTKGEGGYDGDTIEDIRAKLPVYMKTQNRAVTGPDYKAVCENFASPHNGVIGKAAIALRNQGCGGNIVDIYILAQDGPIGLTKANNNLKKELSDELIKKKMFSDYVCLRDGEIVLVDIVINVVISLTNKQHEAAIKEKTSRRIGNFLALKNFEFGQLLKDSDIIKAIADIKEIEHMDVSFTTVRSIEEGHGSVNVVSVAFHEIIRPDNIIVNFQYK